MCQTVGDRGTGLCQHLCAEAHAPFYVTFEIESGCTMEIVRSGSQYRQDPQLWGTDLSPGGAKKTKTAYNARIWSLGGTLDGEGSPKNRFFDSLVRITNPSLFCSHPTYKRIICFFKSTGDLSPARV